MSYNKREELLEKLVRQEDDDNKGRLTQDFA
jgi:hypothetical protein